MKKKKDSNRAVFHLSVKLWAVCFQKWSADSGKPAWSFARQGSFWEVILS